MFNYNKTKVYGVVGFALGYYVGRHYDLKIVFERARNA